MTRLTTRGAVTTRHVRPVTPVDNVLTARSREAQWTVALESHTAERRGGIG